MQRTLYRLEDRLFYHGMLLPFGLHAKLYLLCSRLIGSAGDRLG
jgi:hypothetical protein